MSSIQDYWDAIPPITKGYLSMIMLSTVGFSFGFVNPNKLYFTPETIIKDFELWRLITNFCFFGKFSFMFVMQLMLVSRFGSGYENDPFPTSVHGGSIDYLFALMFIGTTLLVISSFMTIPFLGQSMVFSLIYLWSRRNPNAPVAVWGFKFTGTNLPWVFLLFSMLMGNPIFADVVGLIASNVYYVLIEVLPLKYNRNFLTTPEFVVRLYDLLTSIGRIDGPTTGSGNQFRTNQNTGTASAPNPWRNQNTSSSSSGGRAINQGNSSSEHTWGTGRRLKDY